METGLEDFVVAVFEFDDIGIVKEVRAEGGVGVGAPLELFSGGLVELVETGVS